MFLKKITAIYLILSLLEFLIVSCQMADEINPEHESGGTYIETPNFNNLNPMASDMSDPIIKELTKHYAELLNRKSNSDDDDDDNDDNSQQNSSEEINSKEIATETTLLQQQQQPLKIDIPAQLDELNETDDIETHKKFFITTLIPDLLMQLKNEQNNNKTITEIIEKLDIDSTVTITPTPPTAIENHENKIIETNENETEIVAGENYERYYDDDQIEDRNYHTNNDDDNDNNDENDSKSSSSTLLVSAEINDTSEIANEMKQNILYTDEIDENNLLRVYNHTTDITENLMGDLQNKSPQDNEQQNTAFPGDSTLIGSGLSSSSISSSRNGGNGNENDTADIELLLDEPEMLIATTTSVPQSTLQTTQRIGKQGKQGKQINHREKILRPHEKLRNFIEDPYSRNPIAAIIDPSENVLERARLLWKNSLRSNTELDIILLALVNRTALPLIYHLDNTRTFLAGLNSMKESTDSDPFSGVLKATELIPYDSAVFICVEAVEPNPELANYAGILLLKKRIKLYLIWFGERKSKDTNEPVGGMLGKIALRSGGEIIYMDEMNIDNSSNDLEDNMITLVSDSFRGSQEIDIPIDTTVSSIQMKIDSQMRTATLETPTGG